MWGPLAAKIPWGLLRVLWVKVSGVHLLCMVSLYSQSVEMGGSTWMIIFFQIVVLWLIAYPKTFLYFFLYKRTPLFFKLAICYLKLLMPSLLQCCLWLCDYVLSSEMIMEALLWDNFMVFQEKGVNTASRGTLFPPASSVLLHELQRWLELQ